MDQNVVRRVKIKWAVTWLGMTFAVLLGWGLSEALIAALMYVVVSVLACVAFILYLLLGDVPVAYRILLIVLFLMGLVVEVLGMASILGILLT